MCVTIIHAHGGGGGGRGAQTTTAAAATAKCVREKKKKFSVSSLTWVNRCSFVPAAAAAAVQYSIYAQIRTRNVIASALVL